MEEIVRQLRQRSSFLIPSVNTVFRGTESIRFLGPKISHLIPNEIKCPENLNDFKIGMKKRKPASCTCVHDASLFHFYFLFNNCFCYSCAIVFRFCFYCYSTL